MHTFLPKAVESADFTEDAEPFVASFQLFYTIHKIFSKYLSRSLAPRADQEPLQHELREGLQLMLVPDDLVVIENLVNTQQIYQTSSDFFVKGKRSRYVGQETVKKRRTSREHCGFRL